MNTRPPLENPSSTVALYLAFNDDASCFTVGTNAGFCIFNTESCALKTIRDFNAGVGLVEMMGKANYLGLVGGGTSPKFPVNKLVLWDEFKSKSALDISALTPVRGIKLSKERIVVVLQNSVRAYKFAKPPTLVSAYETANNPWGLSCLSQRVIAIPHRTPGHIQIVDIASGNVDIIPAHTSPVRAIALSQDGEMVATAGETGTIIRVFSLKTRGKIAEFRRGIDPSTIFSLAFNPSCNRLACTSDKFTLHIFNVPHPRKGPPPDADAGPSGSTAGAGDGKGRWGMLSKIPLMPRVFSDTYSICSCPFEAGEDENAGGLPSSESTTPYPSRPPKGILGWRNDEEVVVIGAGKDIRWESFHLSKGGADGSATIRRAAWKRFLV